MKIQDAKPGDVLRDESGGTWVVLPGKFAHCVVVNQHGGVGGFTDDIFSAERFGPFTRLVPEKETP